MALPKKKSRTIEVGEESYRWIANGNDHGIDIYVELSENPGQLLYGIAEYEYENEKQLPVTASHIKKMIEMGLSLGWEPEKNKSKLKLEQSIGLKIES